MKTTNLEKLRDAYGVILLQQMFNKDICILLEDVDQRIRNLQKQLRDKKMELESELCRIQGQNKQPSALITGNRIDGPDHDPATEWINPDSWVYKNQLNLRILSLGKQVSVYEKALAEHEHFKEFSKKIQLMIDKIHQNDELVALLTHNNDELPAASMGKTQLNFLLRSIEKVNNQLYNANLVWRDNIKNYQHQLDMIELNVRNDNFDAQLS